MCYDSGSDRFVLLQGGLVVPVGAIEALLAVEHAGHRVTLDGEDVLIEPRGHLDEHDIDRLRRWKAHVRLLLQYTPTDAHLRDTVEPPRIGPVVMQRNR